MPNENLLNTVLTNMLKNKVQACIEPTIQQFAIIPFQSNPDIVEIKFAVHEIAASGAKNIRKAFQLSGVVDGSVKVYEYTDDLWSISFVISLKENGIVESMQ